MNDNNINKNANDNEKNNDNNKKEFYTLCHKCFRVPSIKINGDKVQVDCSCSYSDNISIGDYINKLEKQFIKEKFMCQVMHQHQNKEAVEFCIQCKKWLCNECYAYHSNFSLQHSTIKRDDFLNNNCPKHKNNTFIYYCPNCNIHCCNLCFNVHLGHIYINLEQYFTNEQYYQIKNRIKVAEDYINIYCENLYKKYSSLITEKIKNIHNEFKLHQNKNNNIIKLVNILLDNYKQNKINNYFVLNNIKNNTTFHFNEADVNNNNTLTLNEIENFFKNNTIIISDSPQKIKELTYHVDVAIGKHESSVNSLCLLNDGRLASCSGDKTIKIYNLNNYNCECTLNDHSSSVNYITQLSNRKLLSCSNDKTIKIWLIANKVYQCSYTINGHSSHVMKVISLSNERFCSCSKDGTIKIWKDEYPYNCIKTLEISSNKGILSMIALKKKNFIVSCVYDGSINFWNIEKYCLETTITGISSSYSPNNLTEIKSERVVIAGKYTITIINSRKFEILHIISDKKFNFVYSVLCFTNENVLFGNSKGELYEMNEKTYEIKLINNIAHKEDINCIVKLNNNFIVTCSSDKFIKLWNVSYLIEKNK